VIILPPRIGSSSVLEGQCDDPVTCTPTFSQEALLRLEVAQGGVTAGDDQVSEVRFTITDSGGNPVYGNTDGDYPFCVFGGGCAGWSQENGVFTFGPGGPAVQQADYTIYVFIVWADASETFWSALVSLIP
jgi:hypothetical protein